MPLGDITKSLTDILLENEKILEVAWLQRLFIAFFNLLKASHEKVQVVFGSINSDSKGSGSKNVSMFTS